MVLHEAGRRLVPEERAVPVPAAGQVLLRVSACAVCRTDLHLVDGELPSPRLPVIPGHEIVGTVEAIGEAVSGFAEGQRVGVPWLGWTCGECRYCRSGRENLCERALFTGYQLDGGYADYTLADHRYCFPLPERFDDLHAAPLMCAGLIGYRSVRMAGDAERIGLYGFGAAAHILTQVLRHQGRRVFAFTRPGDAAAQAFARELGAEWAGGSDQRPPVALDAAILFAPVGALIPTALAVVEKGGVVVCGGIHMSDVPAFPYELLWGERVVRSVANLTRQDGEEFLRIAGEVPLRLEVHPYALGEAQTALDDLRRGAFQGAAVLDMRRAWAGRVLGGSDVHGFVVTSGKLPTWAVGFARVEVLREGNCRGLSRGRFPSEPSAFSLASSSMTDDRLEALRRGLLTNERSLSTSALGRMGRTVGSVIGASVGMGIGRFQPREDGTLSPKDLQRIEALVKSLGQLKGVPMKMGQILAYIDESVPEELRRMLSALQTHSSAVPFAEIEQTLRESLGQRAQVLLATMDRTPVAAASIGQVHRATLPNGTPVAVKVQYRGIEEALRAELRVAGRSARLFSRLLPRANIDLVVGEATERLLGECDYVAEAEWQRRFSEAWKGHPVLRIPAVHKEWSGPKVLVTTWTPGQRFEDWLAQDPPQDARDRIGVALYEFYLGSLYRFGLFNADPHPGNYLLADGGGLVMLDHGCARSYTADRVALFVRLREAVQSDEPARIAASFEALGATPGEGSQFEVTRNLLRAFFAPVLQPGVQSIPRESGGRLGAMVQFKQQLMKLSLPGDLLFLFRIKFGLYAILGQIGARADWSALESGWRFEQSEAA